MPTSGDGGTSSADTAGLRKVSAAVDGLVSGPLAQAQSSFVDAMEADGNYLLQTDTALDGMIAPWSNLFSEYAQALSNFSDALGVVATNFDKAGNGGDIFAAPGR